MTKKETDYALLKFRNALTRLREGTSQAEDELGKDGVIQRFEFTFELLWKALRIVLENKGTFCKTPKDCLQTSFQKGLLEDEQPFLDMLEDRNKTSHIYDESESKKIYEKIKNGHIKLLDSLKQSITSFKN